jgi:outer membrane lipoprotein-sorting protein
MTRKLTLLTFALTLGAVSLSIAQEPTAEDILKKCAAAYQEVKSYQDTATMKVAMKMGPGMEMVFDMPTTFALEKPNKMNMTVKMNFMGVFQNDTVVVSDGKKMWVYMGMAKQYTETDAPPSLDAPALSGGRSDESLLYGVLLSGDPLKALTEGKKNLKLVGSEDLGGKPAYVLTWEQGLPIPDKMPAMPMPMPFPLEKLKDVMFPVKAWVSKEDFLIRQIEMNMSPMVQAIFDALVADKGQMPKEGSEMVKGMQMTLTETHSDIKINQPIPAETFTFKPPAEAKLVKEFDFKAMMPWGPGGETASPFLGKPAPDFTLRGIDGKPLTRSVPRVKGARAPRRAPAALSKPLNLSALRGRPVLLNFWAEF